MRQRQNITLRAGAIVAALLLALSVTSCSFVERNTIGLFRTEEQVVEPKQPAPPPETSTETAQKPAEIGDEQAQKSAVEILWEVPQKEVDGFVINYGYSENSLIQKSKISTGDLETIEDPSHGAVYRYVIKDVEADKPVFISLMSYSGDAYSAPSRVFRVEP